MGVVRKTVQREILDILNNTIFTVDDFEVTFGDPSNKEYIVSIEFKHNTSYKFLIKRYRSEEYQVAVDRSPGDFEEKETEYYETFSDALSDIDEWCIEIRNELKAAQPLYAEVEELRRIIEERISGEKESDEFSAEDIYIKTKVQ